MTVDHTILSLDLGSTTGWCFVRNGVIVESDVVNLVRKNTHPGDRFLRFQNFLSQYKGVSEICYENVPGFKSADAARVHCGLLSIVQMFCHVRGIRMTAIKPKTIKKEFAGNGNADKAAMCRTAHRLGWKNGHPDTDIDHDECDAIALAWVKLKRAGVEPRLQA